MDHMIKPPQNLQIFLAFQNPCIDIGDAFEVVSDGGHSVKIGANTGAYSDAKMFCGRNGAQIAVGRTVVEYDAIVAYKMFSGKTFIAIQEKESFSHFN